MRSLEQDHLGLSLGAGCALRITSERITSEHTAHSLLPQPLVGVVGARGRITRCYRFDLIHLESCIDHAPTGRYTSYLASIQPSFSLSNIPMNLNYDRNRLIAIIQEHALKFGDFTLASGKKASYYLDCRMVTLHPQGANQIAAGMLDVLLSNRFGAFPDAVGGLAIGADPIAASVVVHAGLRDKSLLGFMVRKEPKQHGTGKLVEGPVQPGMKCVIVEDVITSGGSALKAATAARDYGLDVIGVLGIIDRLEGGEAAFQEAGIPLATLFTIKDFLK